VRAEFVLILMEGFFRSLVKTDLFFKFFTRNEASAALTKKDSRRTGWFVSNKLG